MKKISCLSILILGFGLGVDEAHAVRNRVYANAACNRAARQNQQTLVRHQIKQAKKMAKKHEQGNTTETLLRRARAQMQASAQTTDAIIEELADQISAVCSSHLTPGSQVRRVATSRVAVAVQAPVKEQKEVKPQRISFKNPMVFEFDDSTK